MEDKKKEEKAIVVYGKDRLAANASIGMKEVDPMDIRPPQIMLIQKSSTLSDFIDKSGKQAEVGDFFHTSRFEILKEFEAYFIFAAKSKYISRIKPEEGEKEQYKVLGCMADDFSLFGMTFRSSALYTLSKLWSTAMANKIPMYSILCKIETKKLSGEKGEWFIPVLRIVKLEENADWLIFLEDLAKGFEVKGPELTEEDLDQIGEVAK